MQNDTRIQEIRTKAKAEAAMISVLDSKLSDKVPVSKWKLRQGLYYLRDVETFLLPHAVEAQRKVDAAIWIDLAELQLATASKYRQEVHKDFERFGPNMVEVGG
jgi:hypothetical protein